MKNLSLTLLLLCCVSAAFSQNYVVNAKLTGFPDQTKFYLRDLDKDTDVDSAFLVGGKLTMQAKLESKPVSVRFYASYNKKFYYATLLLGADKVTITGDASQFPFNVQITGSKIQDLENILQAQTRDDYKKRNELVNEYFNLNGDSLQKKARSKEIWGVIGKIDKRDDSIRRAFVAKHLNSYPALEELKFLKNVYNHDTLQKMYNSLTPEYRNSNYGKVIAVYLKVGDPLKKGDQYTDLSGMDRDGKQHKLSDIKNKYILVDFSETYCGPCMASAKEMKELVQQYPDKVAIVTYSGDSGKKNWLAGLDRDQPTWLSIWDGTGDNGETMMKYGVTGFPSFFLIDPQGKIVATQVGYDTGVLKEMIKKATDKPVLP